ncbi:proline-rich protein 19 isoform 1-T2 [Anomaloglossus baeobatrachus]|uniref:proline-rich protein 19 n=1 Tax=Anomaloglossus baeobatrachus TaxID=238106 RepID=UPI003F50AA7E
MMSRDHHTRSGPKLPPNQGPVTNSGAKVFSFGDDLVKIRDCRSNKPPKVKRLKTMKELNNAKFKSHTETFKKKTFPRGVPQRNNMVVGKGIPQSGMKGASNSRQVFITENRLTHHQGIFNHEIKSIDIGRLVNQATMVDPSKTGTAHPTRKTPHRKEQVCLGLIPTPESKNQYEQSSQNEHSPEILAHTCEHALGIQQDHERSSCNQQDHELAFCNQQDHELAFCNQQDYELASYNQQDHQHAPCNQQDHERSSYKEQDLEHASYKEQDHEHALCNQQDHEHVSYKEQDHEHTSYKEQDHEHTSYKEQDHEHASYKEQDHELGSCNQQPHERASYKEHPHERASYKEQPHERASHKEKHHERASHKEKHHERASYKEQPHERASHKEQPHEHASHKEKHHERASYKEQDLQHASYKEQDHERGSYKEQDHERGSYKEQDHERASYKEQDHGRASCNQQDHERASCNQQCHEDVLRNQQHHECASYKEQVHKRALCNQPSNTCMLSKRKIHEVASCKKQHHERVLLNEQRHMHVLCNQQHHEHASYNQQIHEGALCNQQDHNYALGNEQGHERALCTQQNHKPTFCNHQDHKRTLGNQQNEERTSRNQQQEPALYNQLDKEIERCHSCPQEKDHTNSSSETTGSPFRNHPTPILETAKDIVNMLNKHSLFPGRNLIIETRQTILKKLRHLRETKPTPPAVSVQRNPEHNQTVMYNDRGSVGKGGSDIRKMVPTAQSGRPPMQTPPIRFQPLPNNSPAHTLIKLASLEDHLNLGDHLHQPIHYGSDCNLSRQYRQIPSQSLPNILNSSSHDPKPSTRERKSSSFCRVRKAGKMIHSPWNVHSPQVRWGLSNDLPTDSSFTRSVPSGDIRHVVTPQATNQECMSRASSEDVLEARNPPRVRRKEKTLEVFWGDGDQRSPMTISPPAIRLLAGEKSKHNAYSENKFGGHHNAFLQAPVTNSVRSLGVFPLDSFGELGREAKRHMSSRQEGGVRQHDAPHAVPKLRRLPAATCHKSWSPSCLLQEEPQDRGHMEKDGGKEWMHSQYRRHGSSQEEPATSSAQSEQQGSSFLPFQRGKSSHKSLISRPSPDTWVYPRMRLY